MNSMTTANWFLLPTILQYQHTRKMSFSWVPKILLSKTRFTKHFRLLYWVPGSDFSPLQISEHLHQITQPKALVLFKKGLRTTNS